MPDERPRIRVVLHVVTELLVDGVVLDDIETALRKKVAKDVAELPTFKWVIQIDFRRRNYSFQMIPILVEALDSVLQIFGVVNAVGAVEFIRRTFDEHINRGAI